jgi:hypothetical protein
MRIAILKLKNWMKYQLNIKVLNIGFLILITEELRLALRRKVTLNIFRYKKLMRKSRESVISVSNSAWKNILLFRLEIGCKKI